MKVLQINSVCGYGSTGSIAVDIATLLMKEGHQCSIAYGQGTTTYKNSFKIGSRIENHLHNACSRLFGNQGYYSTSGTRSLIQYIRNVKPDIIHLHNLHGNYLNIELLFTYLSSVKLPIVWTLHDCWAFTGKCSHYTAVGCYKWQKECFKCPLYREYPPSLFFDRSRELFADKKKWFTSIEKMTIVPVSGWLAHEVAQSFLGEYLVRPISNWVDFEKFSPHTDNVFTRYGIQTGKFIVLGVSAWWSKHASRYQDAVKLAGILPEDTQLVLVGKRISGVTFPSNIIHIPYIHDITDLAKIYSIADVFVHFSAEDTFGKVIAEAMACGTPAIVYNSTACPELIGKGCGYIVEPHNIQEIKKAVNEIREKGKLFYSAQCISHVHANFDYHTNAQQYLSIYLEMIKK